MPVNDIERPVGSELQVDRAEVAVGGDQQILAMLGGKAGAVFHGLVLLDAEPEGPQGQVVEITLIETSFAEGRSFELAGQLRAAGESA